MALAFVNRAESTVTSTPQSSIDTAAVSHTAGNLLVVFLSYQSTNPTEVDFSTLTDLAGNTYVQAGSEHVQTNNHLRVYYAYDCLGHATNVVTLTLQGSTGTSGF